MMKSQLEAYNRIKAMDKLFLNVDEVAPVLKGNPQDIRGQARDRPTLTVQKGEQSGQSFSYENNETVLLARHGDCSIRLTDSTVSGHHCIVEIVIPSVMVRDCGSLNGTYINGTKIGQRNAGDQDVAAESVGYPMNPGDRLGLGKSCELRLDVKMIQRCSICKNAIEEILHNTSSGALICNTCHSNPDKVLKFLMQRAHNE